MEAEKLNLESYTWQELLKEEREQDYFKELLSFIESERRLGKIIYPPNGDIFNAIKLTPFSKIKVVILGQDPYHRPNQAHGLSFSVRPGISLPPSLKNILLEIANNLPESKSLSQSGTLTKWAEEGVLLLNAVLTVEAGKPNSHAKKGWEIFTDKIISLINENLNHKVFLLWGAYAGNKSALIDSSRHLVLKAPHPSPFSANKGFFGCQHFSKANNYLEENGQTPIDWKLNEKAS
jgi:uracil-DNA glycosylase